MKRKGYDLVYTGYGDNKHRHYPHGFVTRARGSKIMHQDQRRRDTVKCIPACFEVWEYVPIKAQETE
jgi:hypothetical protein